MEKLIDVDVINESYIVLEKLELLVKKLKECLSQGFLCLFYS